MVTQFFCGPFQIKIIPIKLFSGGEEVKNPNPWFVFIQFEAKGSSR